MSIFSVSLTTHPEDTITQSVKNGLEETVNAVLLSQKEAYEGKLLEGDLRKLVKALF